MIAFSGTARNSNPNVLVAFDRSRPMAEVADVGEALAPHVHTSIPPISLAGVAGLVGPDNGRPAGGNGHMDLDTDLFTQGGSDA